MTTDHVATAAVLDAAPRCRTVARDGSRHGQHRRTTSTCPVNRSRQVSNVPDDCIEEVSDHTAAFILALTRRLVGFHAQVSAGEWDRAPLGKP